MSSGEDTVCVTVGVLALQGAFHEHMARFASLNASAKGFCVRPIAVRRVDQLEQCHALVIPGGESTAIALGLRNAGLTEPVREWIRRGRPVWGTCAGMIMLAAIATGGKRGGQELLGGMDIQVGRNGFGSQVYSFECDIQCPALGAKPFPGVFIRAPVVERLLSLPTSTSSSSSDNAQDTTAAVQPDVAPSSLTSAPVKSDQVPVSRSPADMHSSKHSVEPIAWLPATEPIVGESPAQNERAPSRIVALRQGRLLVTSFHPELTADTRLHCYFVREMVLPSM